MSGATAQELAVRTAVAAVADIGTLLQKVDSLGRLYAPVTKAQLVIDMGLVIGTDVQAYDAQLDDLSTTEATAAELDELTDGSQTELHSHVGVGATFLDLTDTPASYDSADIGKVVRIKSDLSGLEFYDIVEHGHANKIELDKVTDGDHDVISSGNPHSVTPTELSLVIGTNVLAEQIIGIADDNLLEVDDADAANTDYARFTANGLQGRDTTEVKTDLGLVIGTNVQAYDVGLLSLAGLTYAAAAFVKMTGANTFVLRTIGETADDLQGTIDHDLTANYDANKHIDHTGVILTAGTGLTGGGDISSSRSFAVDGVLEDLDSLGVAASDGQFIVATGAGVFAYEATTVVRTSLGLGTGDSPQFTAIELGHVSDTTITRASAGDLNIEGNLVYRAGGTDVSIGDGGTGQSTAQAAIDALTAVSGATNEHVLTKDTVTGNAIFKAVVGGGAHTIVSHSDTTGTGAELDELTDGSETLLHEHAEIWEGGSSNVRLDVLILDAEALEASGAGYLGYIKVSDVKAQNTNGGTFTVGAWRTRVLNTEDSDTNNDCSLASNQITLAAGTYECLISAPAYFVNSHQIRLYNTTGAAVILTGTSETCNAVIGGHSQTRSFIVGRFTIAASQALEVQHICETTKTNDGLGAAANFTSEIYTIAEFRRVL